MVITLGVIGDLYTGLIFGAYSEPGSPWFHVVFLLPLYSLFIPVSILKRIALAHVFSFTYYAAFILPFPQHWGWEYHGISVLLTSSCSSLLAVAGHFYFGLIRRNYFQQQELEREREKSDELLLNILPERVSRQLKEGNDVSQRFEEVTVLFADIVNFTPLANKLSAEVLVSKLDDIFSSFDREIQKDGLEKIKTIGDEYFVVAGVPEPIYKHALLTANYALNMLDAIKTFKRNDGKSFNLRIGIHSGPLVAGIIGEGKFVYDVWGDTVNIGSRMESQGKLGKIQITPSTKEAIVEQDEYDRFKFEERGTIEVKGKGEMTTYFLNPTKYTHKEPI